MTDKTIVWTDPTVRKDGAPLMPEQIKHIAVGLRVAGALEFTMVSEVPPGVMTFTQTDLPPGDYEIELIVVDTQDPALSSDPTIVTFTIKPAVLAPPSEVTNAHMQEP